MTLNIDHVEIRRFKRIHSFILDPDEITVLVGANNSGKSSVLHALHFAVSLAQSARLYGKASWRAGKFETSLNPQQLLYSPSGSPLALGQGGDLGESESAQVEVLFRSTNGDDCKVSLRRGRNANLKLKIEGRNLGERLQDLANPFTIFAPGLAGIPRVEEFRSIGSVRRIVARGDANLVLRNVLLRLSENAEAFQQFHADIRRLFPGITFHLSHDHDTSENIDAGVTLAGSSRIPIDLAGTSVLQASQLLGYVTLFKPKVLILDEPDSHLHPNNQRALCQLLSELAAQRGFQLVVATHSRHVVDAMRTRSKLVWMANGGVVEGADLTTTSHLMELGALDSVDYFADGHARAVVATEDSDVSLLRTVLLSSGFNLDETAVVSYEGCSKLDSALVLGNFVTSKAPNIEFIVHRDRDFQPAPTVQQFVARLATSGLRAFVTAGNDIESHFLSPQHLHAVCTTITPPRIDQILLQAMAETRLDSIAAVVNQRTQDAFVERNRTGTPVNSGAIATSSMTDYDANPLTMRHGKTVLRRLRSLLAAEGGAQVNIIQPSPALDYPELRQMATDIWAA